MSASQITRNSPEVCSSASRRLQALHPLLVERVIPFTPSSVQTAHRRAAVVVQQQIARPALPPAPLAGDGRGWPRCNETCASSAAGRRVRTASRRQRPPCHGEAVAAQLGRPQERREREEHRPCQIPDLRLVVQMVQDRPTAARSCAERCAGASVFRAEPSAKMASQTKQGAPRPFAPASLPAGSPINRPAAAPRPQRLLDQQSDARADAERGTGRSGPSLMRARLLRWSGGDDPHRRAVVDL